ncbi:multidrug transporter [Tenacibaculum sp. M341]|uniref:multidrug transporter n=1 Tax=Tenacibaculum sp. M341 TaxID=2530339 RepID=UPI00104A4DF3|nr:multidrug transporter [Tenacibaculum sp. M341]TCI84950.1 multidrug transporter [Tenacibaculum sp. M341]
MKNQILIGLALAASLFTSCGDDGTSDIIITDNSTTTTNNNDNNNGGETILLKGNYSSDLVLDAKNQYILDGPVVMEAGTTMQIPAGMTIKANKGTEVYLAISQDAKIVAEGTAAQPIVFTSNSTAPNAGDWGGLILLGKAPTNVVDVTTGATATSEIASLPYGGTVTDDSSGTLEYVRVEYSGGKVDGQSENNGISFYGVGNGTIVNYIQAFEGLDDGVEFFGGTVNASYISVVNSDDDSVDWTEGYNGTLTNVYVKQNLDGDKAFECDGYNTDVGNNSNPINYSAPNVSNVTIEGLGSANGKEAIRLRAGTKGIFDNVVIKGYQEGFDLDGDADVAGSTNDNPTGQGVIDGLLQATNVLFTDVTTEVKNDTGFTFNDTDFVTVNAAATGTDYATWGAGWTRN